MVHLTFKETASAYKRHSVVRDCHEKNELSIKLLNSNQKTQKFHLKKKEKRNYLVHYHVLALVTKVPLSHQAIYKLAHFSPILSLLL